MKNAIAKKNPVTVMFIDADHLKYINDTFGHDMGNLEIRGIADGIRKVFPPEAFHAVRWR